MLCYIIIIQQNFIFIIRNNKFMGFQIKINVMNMLNAVFEILFNINKFLICIQLTWLVKL